jgi:bifunctional non-homologous end joining protein LigD
MGQWGRDRYGTAMSSRLSRLIAPCLPIATPEPPTGDRWIHEIKHDGYRLMAWRGADRVGLFTRDGQDWADRYPLVVKAVQTLPVRSCLLDGELVVTRPDGVASFELLRGRKHDAAAILYAFDLIELDGQDLRREPLAVRKATLASLLAKAGAGLRLNEHLEGDGPTVFAHARKLGLEGIVSKLKDSTYRSGPSRNWLKSKNPDSEAARREATEDWSA